MAEQSATATKPTLETMPSCRSLSSVPGRQAMIKKGSDGYRVLSSKGKNLGGPYKTREEALKRLGQVEFFQGRKGVETKRRRGRSRCNLPA